MARDYEQESYLRNDLMILLLEELLKTNHVEGEPLPSFRDLDKHVAFSPAVDEYRTAFTSVEDYVRNDSSILKESRYHRGQRYQLNYDNDGVYEGGSDEQPYNPHSGSKGKYPPAIAERDRDAIDIIRAQLERALPGIEITEKGNKLVLDRDAVIDALSHSTNPEIREVFTVKGVIDEGLRRYKEKPHFSMSQHILAASIGQQAGDSLPVDRLREFLDDSPTMKYRPRNDSWASRETTGLPAAVRKDSKLMDKLIAELKSIGINELTYNNGDLVSVPDKQGRSYNIDFESHGKAKHTHPLVVPILHSKKLNGGEEKLNGREESIYLNIRPVTEPAKNDEKSWGKATRIGKKLRRSGAEGHDGHATNFRDDEDGQVGLNDLVMYRYTNGDGEVKKLPMLDSDSLVGRHNPVSLLRFLIEGSALEKALESISTPRKTLDRRHLEKAWKDPAFERWVKGQERIQGEWESHLRDAGCEIPAAMEEGFGSRFPKGGRGGAATRA
ncbi:MAG: hypothetical protein SFT92_02110 [Rickettsiales bacterium]|nr:hypothetical protein [Rickettsiales bacterium]